jgi:putative membrane protein
MSNWVLRWLVFASAIGAVAWLLPGIHVGRGPSGVWTVLVAAAALGLVNVFVKPLLMLLSCPLILVTFGLFLFVINAAMLLLASALSQGLGCPFYVDGWGSAIWGSILITILNWVFSSFVRDEPVEEPK